MVGVTWMLANDVCQQYDAFLTKKIQASDINTFEKADLEFLHRNLMATMPLRAAAHDSGKRVPIGGISIKHIPQWLALEVMRKDIN